MGGKKRRGKKKRKEKEKKKENARKKEKNSRKIGKRFGNLFGASEAYPELRNRPDVHLEVKAHIPRMPEGLSRGK